MCISPADLENDPGVGENRGFIEIVAHLVETVFLNTFLTESRTCHQN